MIGQKRKLGCVTSRPMVRRSQNHYTTLTYRRRFDVEAPTGAPFCFRKSGPLEFDKGRSKDDRVRAIHLLCSQRGGGERVPKSKGNKRGCVNLVL